MTKKSKRLSKKKKEVSELNDQQARAATGQPVLGGLRSDSDTDKDQAEDGGRKEAQEVPGFYDYEATAYSPPQSPPEGSYLMRSASKEEDAVGAALADLEMEAAEAERATEEADAKQTRQARAGQRSGQPRTPVVLAEPHPGTRGLSRRGQEECGHDESMRGDGSPVGSPVAKAAGACKMCRYLQACLDRERMTASQHRMKIEHNSSFVTLNVGGMFFTTSVSTLSQDPNSMLSAMFSGRYAPAKDDQGRYFIDRDGTHFRYVLNFLRDGSVRLPEDLQALQELMVEAQYYQISGLIKTIGEAPRMSKKEYITLRYLPANTYDGWPIRIEGPLEPHIICELHGGVLPPDRETADVRNMYGQPSTGWKVRGVFLTKIFNIIASYGWVLTTSNGSGGGKQRNFAEMYVFCRSKHLRRKRLQRKRRSASYTYNHLFSMEPSFSSAPSTTLAPSSARKNRNVAHAAVADEEDGRYGFPAGAISPAPEPAIPNSDDEESMAILIPLNVSAGTLQLPAERVTQ